MPAGRSSSTLHPFNLRILAEDLVRVRRPDDRERYAASQRQARIDPNPHQIDAGIFALRRLREGGCILADEVGRGKTIEAGLVIAQSRAEGVDGPELEREERQRVQQARNAGSWGSKASGNGSSGDPAEGRRKGGLMSYEQLYALWERQNWRAHELDFTQDREHWLVTPAEAIRPSRCRFRTPRTMSCFTTTIPRRAAGPSI